MKFHLLFLLLLLNVSLMAQEKTGFTTNFRLSQTTAVGSGKDLPFWMTSNQKDMFTLHNSSYFLTLFVDFYIAASKKFKVICVFLNKKNTSWNKVKL